MNLYASFLPLYLAVGGALFLLLMEAVFHEKSRNAAPVFAAAFSLGALALDLAMLAHPGSGGALYNGCVVVDRLTLWTGAVVLTASTAAALFASTYLRREKAVTGEYYALLLLASSGALVLSAAADLITLFVGLELLSLPAYVLAGYLRVKEASAEAALKYFLPGAFASALYLFGAALLYGASGDLAFQGIRAAVTAGTAPFPLVVAGGALVLSALAFKVAAAPFHAWAPDAYEGAPGPSSAFLSTAVKAAAFTALLRLFDDVLPGSAGWGGLLAVLAVLTMTAGNLGALAQHSVKRMLAYSSVAHAGYVLVGLAAIGRTPLSDVARAVSFYLMAYTFMTAGAFGWLAWASGRGEKAVKFKDFRGYGKRDPLGAVVMTLFLFALAGMPPTAGFFGKYLLFKLAVDHGLAGLALVAVLFSLLSFAYYLKLVIAMYMEEGEGGEVEKGPTPLVQRLALALCAAGVLAAGFLRMPF